MAGAVEGHRNVTPFINYCAMAQVFLNPLEDSGFKILFRKKRNMVGLLETILDRKIYDLELYRAFRR